MDRNKWIGIKVAFFQNAIIMLKGTERISEFPNSFCMEIHRKFGETDIFLWEIEGKGKFPFPS